VERKELRRLLKILSGGPRLEILSELKRRRMLSVGDVASSIHRSLNTASLHLSLLEREGIVARRRRDKYVFYRLALPQHPLTRLVLSIL